MVCYLLLLLMCVTSGQFREISPDYMRSPYCTQNECVNGYCHPTDGCTCDSGYYLTTSKVPACKQCPGEEELCSEHNCCSSPETLACVDGRGQKYCIRRQNDSFMMAAQVALGAALTIAFVALIALFWKTCPRNPRGRLSSLLRDRESSLTSMQRFILQRLRDRPPRYDDNNQIRIEKPPPYEEAAGANVPSQLNNAWTDSPPRYSATTQLESDNKNKEVQAATSAQSSEGNESHLASSSSGIVNSAFTISGEENQTVHKHEGLEGCRTSQTGKSNYVFTLTDEGSQSEHVATEHHI